MSSNTISDVTAALGAMTPQATRTGQPKDSNSSSTGVQETNTNADSVRKSQGLSKGGGSAFGKYNRQMLISSYLNRGKEGPISLDPPLRGENNPKEKDPFEHTKEIQLRTRISSQ
ncbi:hypothetical protein DFH28DRAFT_927255 [Melampsora americana]|nr:hypothetical protein DFH28DRAFT_927255 [Melampsora americana]